MTTRGRGRLSSIELLPEEASDIVVWAAQELAGRDRTLTDIYAEFRQKLIALQGEQGLAFDIPAFSSFHRYSVRQAALMRRLAETREISSSLAGRLDGVASEDMTSLVIDMLKTLVFEIVDRGGEAGFSPKQAMELSRAIKDLVATTKLSAGERQRLSDAIAATAEEAIDQAAGVAREAGVSADRIAQMRRDFLGVRPKPAVPAGGGAANG